MAKISSTGTLDRMAAIQKDELYCKLFAEATYQIDAMCEALQTAARADVDTLPYLVQGIAQRIIDLNGGLMELSSDDGSGDDNFSYMRDRLYGTNQDVQPSAGMGS